MSKEKDIIDSIISQNCHGNERLCQDVKNAINEIAFDTNYTEQERKEAYNTFYTKLLNSTGDDQKYSYSIEDLCYLAKTDGTNVHLWGEEDRYTDEIEKMYNILTSSLAVLCNSSDSCNFEDMKKLQLEILDETNKLVIKGLGNIDMELNNTIEMIDPKNDNLKVGASETEEGASETEEGASETEEGAPVLRNLAAIFGASYEFINNTIITPANVEVFAGIINKMIFIMQHPIDTFFGALDCYNRFLISAIGNKLTTILNSITIAGIAVSIGISAGHAVLVDTLNEQNLLQLAATFYYYSQFINPTLSSLFKFKQLGDSIKIHLMTKIPNLAKEKIDIAANTIRYYIDKLAERTEEMTLEHTEKVVEDITNITNITEIIENAIPADSIIENGKEILLMDEADRSLLESYLNKNVYLKDGGLEEGPGQFKKKKKKKNNTHITGAVKKGIPNKNNNNKAAAATAEENTKRNAELKRRRDAAKERRDADHMNVEGGLEEVGQGPFGGGKKHKKSHKKRHQKTHKKQLKPKAKSHKKKNKPNAKSHKKK